MCLGQVAERTLFLWNNDYIVKHINFNREKLFSIISGALYTNSKNHWNSTVHGTVFVFVCLSFLLKVHVRGYEFHEHNKDTSYVEKADLVDCDLAFLYEDANFSPGQAGKVYSALRRKFQPECHLAHSDVFQQRQIRDLRRFRTPQ